MSYLEKIIDSTKTAKAVEWSTLVFLLIGVINLGYFTTQSDTSRFFSTSIPLFTLFLFINFWIADKSNFWFFIGVAVFLRLVLLPSFPLLSDDIFRFIWDGHLLQSSINPFEQLPSFYAAQGYPISGLSQELYVELNSPDYYTIYPPVAQFTFFISTLLSPNSWLGAAIVLRLFLIFFEIGSIFLIIKLLQHFELPEKNVLLYALNPLIIIEITGNLHFEGAVIFFLLLSFYLIVKNKIYSSAIIMGLSIASKLLPLLFLPFYISRLGWSKGIRYFLVIGLVLVLLFAPMMGAFFIEHFGESLDLYFRKFEFNASIYYICRWIGYQFYGYNTIQSIGPALAFFTFSGILLSAILEKKSTWKGLPVKMLFAICLYLLFTTTVHPWYVALPLVLCVFTRFRFPILWSGLVWLTYTNYAGDIYEEKTWAVVLEYSLVVIYALWELFISRSKNEPLYKT